MFASVRSLLLPLIALGALSPSSARAHAGLLSQGEYRFEDGEVVARLVFAAQELADSIEGTDRDGDVDLSAAELETAATRDALEKGLLGKIAVTAAGAPCVARLEKTALVEAGSVEIDVRWRCPAGASEATVDAAFLPELDPGHRHLVTMLGTTSSDVSIAPSVIEPLIALSIAWVGVENFFAEDASKRWRITLPFA